VPQGHSGNPLTAAGQVRRPPPQFQVSRRLGFVMPLRASVRSTTGRGHEGRACGSLRSTLNGFIRLPLPACSFILEPRALRRLASGSCPHGQSREVDPPEILRPKASDFSVARRSLAGSPRPDLPREGGRTGGRLSWSHPAVPADRSP